MKAAAYIRASSIGQLDGHSLDAQERLFGELCKNRGWEPIKVYREEGRSAHNKSIARRPVFKQLLDKAGRGLFDVVFVPEADAAQNAGRLIEHLSTLWEEANMEERRKLLLTMLDGIYFDTKEMKSIVAIKPKPAFMPIFQVAVTREGSDVVLMKDPPPALPPEAGHTNTCSWWRRGGVDLHLKRGIGVRVLPAWNQVRVPVMVVVAA